MGTQLLLPQSGTDLTPIFGHICCGQTAGWIKMPFGMEVGIGPGDIVLDGDPAPQKGGQPPIFGPSLLWPSGWRVAGWIKMPVGTKVGLGPTL